MSKDIPAIGLERDYFRKVSPATIISTVTAFGLSEISKWSVERLDYVGWSNNPIIDRLYSLGNQGIWASKQYHGTAPDVYLQASYLDSIKTDMAAVEVLLTDIKTATESVAACIDTNRLKTIETP